MSDIDDATPLLSSVHNDLSQIEAQVVEVKIVEVKIVEVATVEVTIEEVKPEEIKIEINDEVYCYVCLETDDKLVKACKNVNCKAKVHKVCISRQVHIGQDRMCGICKSEIIDENVEAIEIIEAPEEIIQNQKKRFLDAFLIVCGSVVVIMMALGKNIEVSNLDIFCACTLLMVVPLIFLFSYHHKYDQSPSLDAAFKTIRDSYTMRFLLFIFSNMLIILAHLLGYKIVSCEFSQLYQALLDCYSSIS